MIIVLRTFLILYYNILPRTINTIKEVMFNDNAKFWLR